MAIWGGVLGGVAMDEKALGKRLQLARKRAGLTQQELCQKAGLSYSTLAKIERGAIRSPSVFTVAAIAQATNTSMEELMQMEKIGGSHALPAKKRSKTGVRFVYFDINGVIVRFFNRAFTDLAQHYGANIETLETLFWRHNGEICSGKMTVEEFNSILAKELGTDQVDWQSYYMKYVEPVPGTKEFMAWAAENYEVGILSDSMPGFIDGLRAKGYIPEENYVAIVDSSKVGMTKSDPQMYQKAQELSGAQPDEILLVDDNRSNLILADRAGWHVYQFDNYEPEDAIAGAKSALEF